MELELLAASKEYVNALASRVDTLWVLVAGLLVMFMQAGFLLLEVGFSRMKNAGTVAAKVAANFAIARRRGWTPWAVGGLSKL